MYMYCVKMYVKNIYSFYSVWKRVESRKRSLVERLIKKISSDFEKKKKEFF